MKTLIDRFTACIAFSFNHRGPSALYVKGLACYVILKMLLMWQVISIVMQYRQVALPKHIVGKVVLSLVLLLNHHVNIFFIVAILLALAVIVIGPHYFVNFLFCWLCVNLYVINLHTGDGSDFVLLTLGAMAIPLAGKPTFAGYSAGVVQIVLFNVSRLLIQWQLVFLYVSSGLDKLLSPVWRTGEAFNLIRHFEGRYNTTLPLFLQRDFWDVTFSWATIIFELGFGMLIWVRKARPTVLLLAVLFHLMIWWMVTLPDFSLLMMVALLIFVRDEDIGKVVHGLNTLSRKVSRREIQ